MKLNRTKQCAKCPWKVSTDPFDIPDGYEVKKHEGLVCTIAKPESLNFLGRQTAHVMACHHSEPDQEEYCIGWLHNQLGVGNNIGLRIKMMSCENAGEIKVYGEQHEKFEETLPKNK